MLRKCMKIFIRLYYHQASGYDIGSGFFDASSSDIKVAICKKKGVDMFSNVKSAILAFKIRKLAAM